MNKSNKNRDKEIIRTSYVGVGANIFLAAFKTLVGLVSGSIAIIMDAVNNLSDVLSSVITIVGTKLSAKPADAEHPFGHGRIEYFSAIIISIIVLIAGATSLIESVKKIFNPTQPSYSVLTLVVITVAIFVKFLLGTYVKRKGTQLESDSLIASGADALFDSVITTATLVSAVIMLIWRVNLDGYFGTLISLVIIKAGIDMIGSPINQLLGRAIPESLVNEIRRLVMKHEGVYGVYDITLNYYGPNTIIGSLHINVLDLTTAREIHQLTRIIQGELYEKFNMIITVGIYAINTVGKAAMLQRQVMGLIYNHEHVQEVHGFYVDEDKKLITLDVVPDIHVHDDDEFKAHLLGHLKEILPDFEFNLAIDHNYIERR